MARTEFVEFDTHTEKVISPEKLKIIEQWYQTAQRDEDKAGDIDDMCFYEGWKNATESVLRLILDMPMNPDEEEKK